MLARTEYLGYDIRGLLARLWARLFRRRVEIPIPQLDVPSTAKPPVEDADWTSHSFRFKGAILDNLDRYFHYLRKMKNSDPDSYGMMGRAGLHLVPSEGEFLNDTLPDTFKRHRPAFGGVLLHYVDSKPDDNKRINVKFIYFSRRKADAFVARQGATMYEVTMFYTDELAAKNVLKKGNKGADKYGFMVMYRVVITNDFDVVVLKERGRRTIREKHDKKKRSKFSIPDMKFDYPVWLRELGDQHKMSPQDMGASSFCWAATAVEEAALANTRIMVQKGEAAAAFNIPIKRTAYFFKDREPVLDNGKIKRIFHIVRAHSRETKLGTKFVRFHHRGLRQFIWNGFRVTITVPGLHHTPLIEADFESVDFEGKLIPTGMLTTDQAGKLIAEGLTR